MKTTLALAALVIAGGLAVPALAADEPAFDSSWYVTQLQQRGIDAIDVHEGWNGEIRATVQLADGSSVFQYFYEDTLQPVVKPAQANTRVLSRLDVGDRPAAPVVTDSLLIDNFFD